MDGTTLKDALEVWDFCCLYKNALKIPKMTIELFCASVMLNKRSKLVEDILISFGRSLLSEFDETNEEYMRYPVYVAIKSASLISACWPAIIYLVLTNKKFAKTLLPNQKAKAEEVRLLTTSSFYEMQYAEKLKVDE